MTTSMAARPRGPFVRLGRVEYEIDLNAGHSEELRNSLANYVSTRKVGGTARRGAARASRRSSTVDTVAVRTWAKGTGHRHQGRGRVPANIVEQYRAARDSEPQSMGGINLRARPALQSTSKMRRLLKRSSIKALARINDIDRKLLWGRSAGRCAFQGCNKKLTEVPADKGAVSGRLTLLSSDKKRISCRGGRRSPRRP